MMVILETIVSVLTTMAYFLLGGTIGTAVVVIIASLFMKDEEKD